MLLEYLKSLFTFQQAYGPPDEIACPAVRFENGVFQVGFDIAPGTYHSEGPESCIGVFCTFARPRDPRNSWTDVDNVIDVQNVRDAAFVTIEPTDGGFFSQNCKTWVPQ